MYVDIRCLFCRQIRIILSCGENNIFNCRALYYCLAEIARNGYARRCREVDLIYRPCRSNAARENIRKLKAHVLCGCSADCHVAACICCGQSRAAQVIIDSRCLSLGHLRITAVGFQHYFTESSAVRTGFCLIQRAFCSVVSHAGHHGYIHGVYFLAVHIIIAVVFAVCGISVYVINAVFCSRKKYAVNVIFVADYAICKFSVYIIFAVRRTRCKYAVFVIPIVIYPAE